MVRINLINPEHLADQHLIAEYNEILMLFGYIRKYPKLNKDIPEKYCLGEGHILFFKDKLIYLKKRYNAIKKEMKKRGFRAEKSINIKSIPKILLKDWNPNKNDYEIIKKRIITKIKKKPGYYSYCGIKRKKEFFINLLK
ncbi:MAG: pyrimidine dimer DNA glycosylase/endonuclease V [Candidatus Woesearchaeota archaeon]